MAFRLRTLVPYSPADFLTGGLGEWVVLILLCCLFIAICGAVLPKRLTERSYGRVLVIALGLAMGLGLFKAKNLFNFELESFGFLGIGLVLLLAGFVTYGLCRLGFRKDIAFALTFCAMYLTLALVSPSILDALAEVAPILTLIFFLAFIYLGVMILAQVFKRPKKFNRQLNEFTHAHEPNPDEPAIENELRHEQAEEQRLRQASHVLTQVQLRTVEDIERLIDQITSLIREQPFLTQENKTAISNALTRISKMEASFTNALLAMKQFIKNTAFSDTKTIDELEERFKNTKDQAKKKQSRRSWTSRRKR